MNGEGLPIVCLHGWGFDQAIWQGIKSVWPNEWQMITVDLPGHGQTTSMSMEKFISLLLQQLPQHFAIIGWSLGGLYALQLANKAGTRVKHIFAVSTSPCFIKQSDWPGIEPAVLTRFYKRYARDSRKTVHDFIELQFLNQDHKSKIVYTPMLPTDAELGLTLLQECDFRNQLQSISCKISFVLGQQDAIVPISLAKAIKEQFNISDVMVINHCGHMPFLTHSELFIHHLRERIK